MPNPPVKVAKISMGDGTYSSEQIFELLPAVRCQMAYFIEPGLKHLFFIQLSVLTTYPQIIGYDQDVYNYFIEQ